jgi:hypothetical protein
MHKAWVFLAVLLLPACKENWLSPATSKEAASVRWAVVDRREIEEALTTAAWEQNPLPVELRDGAASSGSSREVIAEQLARLESAARRGCMTEELRVIVDRGQSVACEHMRAPECDRLFDQACLAKIPDDPQIAELRKKHKAFSERSRTKERYREAIRVLAREQAKIVIADYAESRFDLVIEKTNVPVIYAKDGMVTDVTEGILEQIRKKPLNLKMTEEQVWAKGERSH